MKKSNSMVEYQKNRKNSTQERVEKTILKFKRSKKNPTKTEFCKMAEVSLQYLYKYPELNAEVDKVCSGSTKKRKQTVESKETIITSLRAENKRLKSIIAEYEKDGKYKAKYDEALERITELEKQLENSYLENLDDNF
ncbi:MAG: hypothetical protein MR016_10985 [Agathobacter sp.]|nr:hypothetical protein [Agathobacter sp.]